MLEFTRSRAFSRFQNASCYYDIQVRAPKDPVTGKREQTQIGCCMVEVLGCRVYQQLTMRIHFQWDGERFPITTTSATTAGAEETLSGFLDTIGGGGGISTGAATTTSTTSTTTTGRQPRAGIS